MESGFFLAYLVERLFFWGFIIMESSAEVNEAIENSHIKRKENDERLPQQSKIPTALENAAQVITPRSPDSFMEHLRERSEALGQASASEQGMMVEELTLNNYRSSGSFKSEEGLTLNNYRSTGLFRTEETSGKKGLWNNFGRLGDGPRDSLSIGGRAKAGNSFMQPYSMKRPLGSPQMEPNYSKVAEHLARSDSRIASRSMLDKPIDGIRTKVLPASGFTQFLVKNSLRGKGVVYKHEGVSNQNRCSIARSSNGSEGTALVGGGSEVLDRQSRKADDKALIGGGYPALKAQNDGISLRDWLMPRHHKMDKVERLQMFKQILKIVDSSHSQGLGLQHLRPSYFLISSSRQIRYVGSFVPKSQMDQPSLSNNLDMSYYSEHHLKRKRYSETNHQAHKSYTMPSYGVPSSGSQPSASEFLDLEKNWYASPEELNDNVISFLSNIYSLGVLLFELFCYFETWELRSVAMSDLRYRILPPSFLSESSKEAGFCLWLLHPEPSSRPNSRDILQSDFISESQDLFPNQPTASIDEEDAEADLLLHFLLNLKEEKEKQAAKLAADVGCLTTDIEEVERRHSLKTEAPDANGLPVNSNEASINCTQTGPIHMVWTSASTANEERLMRNLDQLEKAYFSMRSNVGPSESNSTARPDSDVLKIRDTSSQMQNGIDECNEPTDPLGSFFEGLCKYARYSKFELCGSLRSVDILNSANVICSLSFDRDEEYFATAGVSKKIKIFEFGALLSDNVDIHYPSIEMSSKSKLSCICWNNYIKNYLASTDYEGVIQLWDASTGQGFTQYTEHQKRAWSVDFSVVDPTKLASGSDDCSVKIWSIKERNCIDTIRNVANVCCVQFSPHSSHMLAFGSADYRIYCYDLRYTRAPWCTLAGHGKAVSYVKFIDSVTAISASTDNSLKIWDLNKSSSGGLSTNACCSTLTGHTNEKNFVGLSVCDGYITCGSETNEVYAYYKSLPMPITSHKFGSTDPITGHEIDDDNGQFVSSVCWRSKSNMVLAANSSGSIKLLQLV